MTPALSAAHGALAAPPHPALENTNHVLNISIFAAFVLITLLVVYQVSSRGSSSEYFVAGSAFSGAQNGVAVQA